MITFFIGLVILIAGGAAYGLLCEKIFRPDDRVTPANRLTDGVDFVPMGKWRNCLIQLLNIAGTGPILGPIQGALFGPIAFITIPIGCVIGGAFHDYMCGMISVRCDGEQTPGLIRRFLGQKWYAVYNIFVCLLLLLLGTVFIYTPGDLFVTDILKMDSTLKNPVLWIVYGVIFLYYIIATLLPIDKIIGKIYPVFGGVLILSAVGIFAGMVIKGYPLDELWSVPLAAHPKGLRFIPIFFVTVACGIVSGFHATQSTLISRTLSNERHGRAVFYNMMIAEGFIAMVWAAAAMGVINLGIATADTSATEIVGIVSRDLLGNIGGIIAISGVIILPVTSGDTALRSLRIIVSDTLHIKQENKLHRLLTAAAIFAAAAALLIFAKSSADGFNILWRYFAWANQTIAVFSFTFVSVYMMKEHKPFIMSLLPGMFYMFIISSFILNAKIGFNLSWTVSAAAAAVITAAYGIILTLHGKNTHWTAAL